MGVDRQGRAPNVCLHTVPLSIFPPIPPLTANLFTRATPGSAGRHVRTEEYTVSNQHVPDKLPQVGAERWVVGQEAAGQTTTEGREEARDEFHIPLLTTRYYCDASLAASHVKLRRNEMKLQKYHIIPKAA